MLWTQRDTTLNTSFHSYGLTPKKFIVAKNGAAYSYSIESDNNNNALATVTADSTNGSLRWRNSQMNPCDFTNMAMDSSGNIAIITGYGYAGYFDLTKISPSGTTIWSVQHFSADGHGYNGGYESIATDNYNNFYVLCSTSYPYQKSLLWLIKFDNSGIFQWENIIDSAINGSTDLTYNRKDNSLYLSYAKFFAYPNPDSNKVVKINTNGQIAWMKDESLPDDQNYTVLKKDIQGNIYSWNNSNEYGLLEPNTNYSVGRITKYDTSGNVLGQMAGSSFDVDSKGYTYTTNNFSKKYQNYRSIRKYSPSGILLYDYPDTTASYDYSISEVYTDKANDIYTLNNELNILVRKFSTACTYTVEPAKLKSITGSAVMACDRNTSYTYSIAAVAKANYYNWTVPTGVTIDSGQGTTKIYVRNNSTFKTGTISVYAANCYGASAAISKAVNDTLKKPDTITGAASVCKGQTYVPCSVAAVAGANDYEWTVLANASIVCGNHTDSICVSFGNNAGKLTVTAYNSCGTASPVQNKQIHVINCMAGMTVEAESNKTVVYPNSSSGAFTLKFGNIGRGIHQGIMIVVKEVSGKIVEQLSSVTVSSVSFGSRLMKGIYFVEVISGGGKQVLKIIKE